MDGRSSEISRALHVAFIISGCTYSTYVKVLRHSLGIQANNIHQFQETLRLMYPIVKEVVDDMCTKAMNNMDQEELGSWSRAVTTTDGEWMTRGQHSKNFTFSVRYSCPRLPRAPLQERVGSHRKRTTLPGHVKSSRGLRGKTSL